MKVVLFCGGLGTRLREHTDTVPKPMVNIGQRPILWHLMKYYAYFGHKEFILCLGHMGEQIKEYFINYVEWVSNDFQYFGETNEIRILNRDISDWTVTFADTGIDSSIGQRLRAVRQYLEGEPMFLANYSDGLSDLNLDRYVEWFRGEDRVASFVRVPPNHSFHTVTAGPNSIVREIHSANRSGMWINGGFFIFKQSIFDVLGEGEDLVEQPFDRLIQKEQLLAYAYEGFWACMDTYKDKKQFDVMDLKGETPWKVWLS